jgi:uncharacterized membrane protein (UPF0127 family)
MRDDAGVTAPNGAGEARCARRLLAGVMLVVLVLAAAGCGDDDSGGGSGDSAAGTTTTAPPDSSATTSPAPTGPVSADDLLALTGDAPAARGAGLDEPPGAADRTLLDGFAETAAAVTTPDGTVIPWCLLLAASQEQRNRGLMEVTDLAGYAGMVFAWPEDSSSSFYMLNTPTPLSIGWFDAEGELVSTEDMDPCPDTEGCPLYSASGPYRFAVEVPQGELDRLGIGEGSRLSLGGPCA